MGEACEIIISCVGDDDDLREITISPTGCFQTMQKNTIFIDHSTTSFDVAQEVNRFAVERSLSFLMRLYLVEHLERKRGLVYYVRWSKRTNGIFQRYRRPILENSRTNG